MEEEIHFPKDIKKTKQRVDIFRILSAASRPMSAAEIYQCLIKKTDGTNFAISTVYRGLAAFEEKGYVTKSTLMGAETCCYEWNQGRHRHYAVCLKCHKLVPLEICPFEHEKIHGLGKDFTVTGHKLELYGFCRECDGEISDEE
ncbi:MAG: transcriptional repressor [Kineothrix sp.]|nr:transcriptional repressor [Kineothrix sp.]